PIAVLLHDVHALVTLDKLVNLACEWIGPQAQVVGLQHVFLAKLITTLNDGPVAAAKGDNPNTGAIAHDLGRRSRGTHAFELVRQPVHVPLIIVRTLAVLRLLVVPAAAREVRRRGMIGSWQGAVADAVAVNVLVARESADFVELLLAQDLAA